MSENNSVIFDIYESFQTLEIEVNGKKISCSSPSTVPNTITTAHLPLRLLTPISRFSQRFANANNLFNPNQGSTVNQIIWSITDLFLLSPVSLNVGLRFQNDDLISYCSDYIKKLGDGTFKLPNNCWINSTSFRPDVIEYPLLSNNFYFGVVSLFEVSEKIP